MKKSTKIILAIGGGLVLATGSYMAYKKFFKKDSSDKEKKEQSDEKNNLMPKLGLKPKINVIPSIDRNVQSLSGVKKGLSSSFSGNIVSSYQRPNWIVGG